MQLNLGLTMDEEMRKQVVTQQATATSKRVQTFCGASFNGCVCQNICHCTNSDCLAKCFEMLLGKNRLSETQSETLSKSDEEIRRDFNFDATETEEQLHRFLKTEQNTLDVLAENESLKGFLKYMESNYRNQFETQRLIVEDMKLQVEDLLSQLKAASNNLDQKSAENEDLLANLEKRKKDYEDLYNKLKEKEKELERAKADRVDDADALKDLKDKLERKDRLIEDFEDRVRRADEKARKAVEQLKNYVVELQDHERDLEGQLDGQNDALEEFQRKVDDLKRQLKDKDDDLAQKAAELNGGGGAAPKKLKEELAARKRELDKLKDELRRKDDDNKKLKARCEDAEDELDGNKKKAEKLKEAAQKVSVEDGNKQRAIDDLKKKLADAEGRFADKDADAEELKKDLDEARDRLRAAQEDGARKQAVNDLLGQELDKARKPAVRNVASAPEDMVSAAESEELKGALDKLKNKLRDAEQEAEEKARAAEDRERELKSQKKMMDDLDKKLRLITGEKDALKKLNQTAINSSMLNSANAGSELEKKNKLVKDLNDKLEKLGAENDDLKRRLKDALEQLEKAEGGRKKLEEQQAEAQGLIDRLNKDKMGLIKNIKSLKDAKDNLQDNYNNALKALKDSDGELDKARKEQARLKQDCDRMKKEMDKLALDHRDLGNEHDKLKGVHGKMSQDFERLKLQYSQDRDQMAGKITELESKVRMFAENTKGKEELHAAANRNQELTIELEKKNTDFKIKLELLDRMTEETKAKDMRIEEFEMTLKRRTEEMTIVRAELDSNYMLSTELLREVWGIKVFTYDFNALLTDRDTSDLKEQEQLISAAKREQYLKLALELTKDIKTVLKDTYGECEDLQNSVRNLSREKTFLLQKKQELEERASDLQKRHDVKTDMVGKLTVKVFILMNEVQRLIESKA